MNSDETGLKNTVDILDTRKREEAADSSSGFFSNHVFLRPPSGCPHADGRGTSLPVCT